MNKKILTVLALLIVVTSISAVSAFDLGDLFGMGDKNETVTIEGIDFNIPAGFKEDSKSTFNIIEKFIKDGFDLDGKVYTKDNTDVGLFVYNYSSLDLDDNEVVSNFANETSINNVGGYLEFEDNENVFVYTKDKCLVMIASNDKNVIGDFLIA